MASSPPSPGTRGRFTGQVPVKLYFLPSDTQEFMGVIQRLAETLVTTGDLSPTTRQFLDRQGPVSIRRVETALGLDPPSGTVDGLVSGFLRRNYSSNCRQYQDPKFCFQTAIESGDLQMLEEFWNSKYTSAHPENNFPTSADTKEGVIYAIEKGPLLTDTFELVWNFLPPQDIDASFLGAVVRSAVAKNRQEILRSVLDYVRQNQPRIYPNLLKYALDEIGKSGRDGMILSLRPLIERFDRAAALLQAALQTARQYNQPKIIARLEQIENDIISKRPVSPRQPVYAPRVIPHPRLSPPVQIPTRVAYPGLPPSVWNQSSPRPPATFAPAPIRPPSVMAPPSTFARSPPVTSLPPVSIPPSTFARASTSPSPSFIQSRYPSVASPAPIRPPSVMAPPSTFARASPNSPSSFIQSRASPVAPFARSSFVPGSSVRNAASPLGISPRSQFPSQF